MAVYLERFVTLDGASVPLPNKNATHTAGTLDTDVIVADSSGGGGYDPFGSAVVSPGATRLTVRGDLLEEAMSDLEAAFRPLRSLRGRKGKLYRRWDSSGAVQWVWARCGQLTADRGAMRFKRLTVMIPFTVYSAYWRGEQHGAGWVLDSGISLDTGRVLDEATGDSFTLTTSPQVVAVTNGGDTTVTDAILTVTAGGANITALTMATADASLTWTGTLLAGDALVIDTGALTVTNDGADAYSGLTFGGSHAIDDWLRLYPGSNSVTVTTTGGSTDSNVLFTFSDGWE